MQANAVLGVDISKKKFDVCLLVGNKERYKVFQNNHDGFEKLVAWCNHHGAELIHLCLEATGCYSEDIVNFMYDLEHNVSVVNPAQIKAFGRSELLIPIPITRQTDGQRWKKSHNEVSKIVEV